MVKKCVVKRKGHEETYDVKKVYASVYAAALSCHYGEVKSEKIAKLISKKIDTWVKTKSSITSDEIRNLVLKHLKDKDVALMYKHHLDLS
jgi:transcriptional regulator NrdR family protein